MTKCRKEGEVIHVYEDYQNHPYQPPTLTSDQQHKIEEDLVLMTQNGVYLYKNLDSFE